MSHERGGISVGALREGEGGRGSGRESESVASVVEPCMVGIEKRGLLEKGPILKILREVLTDHGRKTGFLKETLPGRPNGITDRENVFSK